MPDLTLKSQLAADLGRRIEATDHDNQTKDIQDLNTSKANKTETTASLNSKADAQGTTDALALKTSKVYVDAQLLFKADAQATNDALTLRATNAQLADVANTAFIQSLLF